MPALSARAVSGSRLLLACVLTGAAAGISGAALTLLLHVVQHVAFGYTEDTFLIGVERASAARRVSALAVGGAVSGLGWWLLRRRGGDLSVEHALARSDPRLPGPRTLIDAVLQIFAVGAGASLGREGAPRQAGAAAGSWIGARLGLSVHRRRTLIACGAGAGLAAVYNVPLGGALFALEILLGSAAVTDVLAAVLSCSIATALAWTVLGDQPTYVVAQVPLNRSLLVWALLFGPLAGLTAHIFNALMAGARRRAPSRWRMPVAVVLAFTALGVAAGPFPQLLGNGKGPAQLAFDAGTSLPLLAVLVLLKPLATAACLGSGARGGLLTPALATGAMLGASAGGLWVHLWPAGSIAGFALIGAAAVLAATQQAPLTALILVLELTHTGVQLLVPMAIAVTVAVGTERLLGGRGRVMRTARPSAPDIP
jgi:H+/Cl- antiporter ClcA